MFLEPPQQDIPFLAFAIPTITGEIRRHFRDTTWGMRVTRRLKELHVSIPNAVAELSTRLQRAPRPSEIAAHLDASTADVLDALQAAHAYRPRSLDITPGPDTDTYAAADTVGRPDPAIDLFIDSHALAPHLAALPPRELRILIMRFYRNMTQTQIANEIGVSQMHVSRLLSTTLRKLRDALQDPTSGNTAVPALVDVSQRSGIANGSGDKQSWPRGSKQRGGVSVEPPS